MPPAGCRSFGIITPLSPQRHHPFARKQNKKACIIRILSFKAADAPAANNNNNDHDNDDNDH